MHCVLLDLGLPDAAGHRRPAQAARRSAGSAAVCVLTGRYDEHLGVAAVAEGAQDYLVKGQVDGVLLTRALRYAVERKRADENARRLREVELRQAESARLERGLLPQPLMHDRPRSRCTRSTAPGRALGLLGGDFFDVVQTGAGHAARDRRRRLRARRRRGARSASSCGWPGGRWCWPGCPTTQCCRALEQVLMSERRAREVFATVAAVTHRPGRRPGDRAAGRPPAAAAARRRPGRAGDRAVPGIVLGVRPDAHRPRPRWSSPAMTGRC